MGDSVTAFPPYLRPVCFHRGAGKLAGKVVFLHLLGMVGGLRRGWRPLGKPELCASQFIPPGVLHLHRLWIPSPVKRVALELSPPCYSNGLFHPIHLSSHFHSLQSENRKNKDNHTDLQIWGIDENA